MSALDFIIDILGKLFSIATKPFVVGWGLILYFFDLMVSQVDKVVSSINQLSSVLSQNLSLSSYSGIGYVNAFFPISEFVAMAMTYVSIAVGLVVIRWILKFIPTIG